ncbi:MAG: endopeptidase La, partial [Firmicutes bacterium]|nr:endopeptidase La [Bacillota bacterium]
DKLQLTLSDLEKILGSEKHTRRNGLLEDAVGVVNGLAYTEVGGDVLPIEVALSPGKGKLKTTGNVGKVMEESTYCALSVVQANALLLDINPSFFAGYDIHIHFPDGSTPKEGASAGAAETLALASAFTKRKVRGCFALTGEVSLTGRVTEIGGVKEKVLAAYRHGITNVILPKENMKNLDKVPDEVKQKIKFHFVETVQEVFNLMLI